MSDVDFENGIGVCNTSNAGDVVDVRVEQFKKDGVKVGSLVCRVFNSGVGVENQGNPN